MKRIVAFRPLRALRHLLAAIACLAAAPLFAAPGGIDTSFGLGGRVLTPFVGPSSDSAEAVVLQPDGRMIVVGSTSQPDGSRMAVTRFNADGTRDTSFNGTGLAAITFAAGDNARATAVALQPDGRIIVAGQATVASVTRFAVTRLLPDGSLDTTFGGTGRVTSAAGGNTSFANAMVLQPDGRILVAGSASVGGTYQFALARFNADGSLDGTFDGDGWVTLAIGTESDVAEAIALQPNGRVVVTGRSFAAGLPRFATARFAANGALDTSFNGTGRGTLAPLPGQYNEARAIAVQPDGKIVVAGYSDVNVSLARYHAAGFLDTGFNGTGMVVMPSAGSYCELTGLAVQADGRLVAAGTCAQGGSAAIVLRLQANGLPDHGFGLDGWAHVATRQESLPSSMRSQGLALAGDGSPVVAITADGDIAAGRILANGMPDLSFDGGLTERVDFGRPATGAWNAVAVQADGRIVVAGHAYLGGSPEVTLARYGIDGDLDASFADEGTATIDIGTGDDIGRGVAFRPDGRVVVAASAALSTGLAYGVAQRRSDGTADASFSANGRMNTVGGIGTAKAVAIEAGGTVLVAGSASNGIDADFGLLRLRGDGTIDSTYWAADGVLRIPMAAGTTDEANAIAVQPDGAIVLAGRSYNASQSAFSIARVLPSGILDNTFSSNGIITPQVPGNDDIAWALALQPDGRIVAAGQTSGAAGVDITLVRLNANGTYDTSFNGTGRVITNIGGTDVATALAIQPDGRIVVAGHTTTVGNSALVVVRYLANGSLDTSFSGDGIFIVNFGDDVVKANALALQPDGGIVVAGVADGIPFVARILGEQTPGPFAFTRQTSVAPGTVVTSNAATLTGFTGSVPLSVAGGSYSIGCTGTFTSLPGTIGLGATVCVRHVASLYPGDAITTSLTAGSRTGHFTSVTGRVASATALGASTNPSGVQAPVTFTATVSGGFGTPQGLVTFRDGAIVLGAVTLDGAGRASLTTSSLTIGAHTITASFGGDDRYDASASSALVHHVAGNVITVTAATGNPSVTYGTPVTFTATLSALPPGAAIVFFYANGNFIGADTTANTTATFATRSLPAGTHAITAEFIGGGSYGAASSPAVTQAVVPAASATMLGSSASPGMLGAPVTLTARVSGLGETVAGTVAFLRSTLPLSGCGAVPVDAGGLARCVVSDLPPGASVLSAHYGGDGNNLASTSATIVQDIAFDPAADADGDAMPNGVEIAEGRNALVKDNDVFGNARLFAMQQYRDFLSREGDAGGINYWVNLLGSGTTRAQGIQGFFTSPEFQGVIAPVARLYFANFLRYPDYVGLQFHVARSRTGTALDVIATDFATSPEFVARYGALSNDAFIELVYQNVLGRPSDPVGKAYWLAQMSAGSTRGQVMLGFSESPEYIAAIGNEVFITMMYVGMLRRAPDPVGFPYWLTQLDGGTSSLALTQGFLDAPEYRSRFLP